MSEIPHFSLYGEDNEESIQPSLTLRQWGDLSEKEKIIALRELGNKGWVEASPAILNTITYLNDKFLRQCPGKHLHEIKPGYDYQGRPNVSAMMKAALADFRDIFLYEKLDAMVLRMLSKLAENYINKHDYRRAGESEDVKVQKINIASAFKEFDRLANCLNHVFEQFSVNQIVTRNGFVPRQDEKIINEIYLPTLAILAAPKWKTVSKDLARMFEDYRAEKYSETITKAHSVVHRFLQILVGEEGKNAKGEIRDLFAEAKNKGVIPINRFTEPIIKAMQGYIPSERATNSTAKPALKEATSTDALLMMNVVMILLQYCLSH